MALDQLQGLLVNTFTSTRTDGKGMSQRLVLVPLQTCEH